jgi:DNA repair ATPase RecN
VVAPTDTDRSPKIFGRYEQGHEKGQTVMGLAASQSRFLTLTARKSDLELTGQQINQSRLQLANVTNDLFNTASTLDPDAKEAIQIQLRINALQSLDQSLELQLRRVDTQQQAVQTELEAIRKIIDKNVELTFKTFA